MPTRTESECTTSSFNDDDIELAPLWDLDAVDALSPATGDQSVSDEVVNTENGINSKTFVTLRERRQIKLGLRKVSRTS